MIKLLILVREENYSVNVKILKFMLNFFLYIPPKFILFLSSNALLNSARKKLKTEKK